MRLKWSVILVGLGILLFLGGCEEQNTLILGGNLPLYTGYGTGNEYIIHNGTMLYNPVYMVRFANSSNFGGWLVYNDNPNSFVSFIMAGSNRTGNSFSQPKANLGRLYTTNSDIAIGTFTANNFTLGVNDTAIIVIDPKGNTTFKKLTGSGNAYACLDSTGKIYRSATACA